MLRGIFGVAVICCCGLAHAKGPLERIDSTDQIHDVTTIRVIHKCYDNYDSTDIAVFTGGNCWIRTIHHSNEHDFNSMWLIHFGVDDRGIYMEDIWDNPRQHKEIKGHRDGRWYTRSYKEFVAKNPEHLDYLRSTLIIDPKEEIRLSIFGRIR